MKNTKLYKNNNNIQKSEISKPIERSSITPIERSKIPRMSEVEVNFPSRENQYMVSNFWSFSKKKLVRITQIYLIEFKKTTPNQYHTRINYSGESRFARLNKKNLIYFPRLVQSSRMIKDQFPRSIEAKFPQSKNLKTKMALITKSWDAPIAQNAIFTIQPNTPSEYSEFHIKKSNCWGRESSEARFTRAKLDSPQKRNSTNNSIKREKRSSNLKMERSKIKRIRSFRSIHSIDRSQLILNQSPRIISNELRELSLSLFRLSPFDLMIEANSLKYISPMFPIEFFFSSAFNKTTFSIISTSPCLLFSEGLRFCGIELRSIPQQSESIWKYVDYRILLKKIPFFIGGQYWKNQYLLNLFSNNRCGIELRSIPQKRDSPKPNKNFYWASFSSVMNCVTIWPIERSEIGSFDGIELRSRVSRLGGSRFAQSEGFRLRESRFAGGISLRSIGLGGLIFDQSAQSDCSIGLKILKFVHFDSLYYRYKEFHSSDLKLQNIQISFELIRKQLKYQKMFSRPLLFLNRFDIKQLCQFWNLSIFPDKTNKKLQYRRNRIRKQLLPLLRFFFNRQIDQILYQFSEITLTEKFYLDYLSVRFLNQKYKDFQLVSSNKKALKSIDNEKNFFYNKKFDKFFIYYIPFGLRKRIFRKVFSCKLGQ